MITAEHDCTKACTHHLVPDRGGRIITRSAEFDRMASEEFLAGKYPGMRIEYLGIAPEHPVHVWRIGAKPWVPVASTRRDEGKTVKREVKAEYRPAVWTGSGEPVGPVDFTREQEAEEQPYPAPERTSLDPVTEPLAGTAAGLRTLAVREGWTVEVTRARGHVPHASYGTPGKEAVDSVALRMVRRDENIRAVHMGGKWSSLWYWSGSTFFTRLPTLDILRPVIALAAPVDFLRMIGLVRS
jgi:hypothetical protein